MRTPRTTPRAPGRALIRAALASFGAGPALPGRRDAWQIETLLDGTVTGFIIPTRTAYDASISYFGVLPEHRGNGHVHELLSQMVQGHHDDGKQRIVGTTDAANIPMRAAFEGAGSVITRVRIVHAQ